MSKIWKVAVSWEMCGEVLVLADTLEEALETAAGDDIALPNGEYVDASWRVDEQFSQFLNKSDEPKGL